MNRILVLFFFIPYVSFAQNKPLVVEGATPNLYLTHTVAPKENYYSIGRLYNISPKEIAPFNKLELEKGLSLGQVIRIPVSNNLVQDGVAAPDEALVPLYHVVKEKEGLYRISTTYNKLPIETIKKWNKITGDAVNNGTRLIVGYLRVKKDLSALAAFAPQVSVAVRSPEEKTSAKPAPVKAEEKKPEVKAVKEQPEPVAKKEDNPVIVEPEPVKKEPVTVKAVDKPVIESRKSKNFNGGYFKNVFAEQTKGTAMGNENGIAAVFKSTSGWDDGKYYCLHNQASPGTIIKITSPSTGKSVYAKVLDVMPDIKQNDGVLIRISNAAAAELGQDSGTFDCTVSFSK